MRVAGWLLLIASAGALAQPTGFVVYTEPNQACLSLDSGAIVGWSGATIQLPPVGAQPLRLHVNLTGYQEEVVEIDAAQAETGHYPVRGVLALRPLPGTGPPSWLYGLVAVAILVGAKLATARRRAAPEPDAATPSAAPPPDPSQLPADQDPRLGKVIGERYELLERIGVGGWGSVFRARDLNDPEGHQVAVKLAQKWVLDLPKGRLRMHREVHGWRRLEHPSMVRLLDADPDAREPYLVMELITGVTLRERIPQGGLSLEQAWTYLEPLLEAVEALHEKERLAHRDLKPENVMLTPEGQLKLMDFGLAKFEDSPQEWDISMQESCRPVMGTPPYLAPEQYYAGSSQATLPLDQYALGMIAYELLTGRYPWPGPVEAILQARRDSRPTPPSHWRELPSDFEAAILRMLEGAPSDRFSSLKEARLALAAALKGSQ